MNRNIHSMSVTSHTAASYVVNCVTSRATSRRTSGTISPISSKSNHLDGVVSEVNLYER